MISYDGIGKVHILWYIIGCLIFNVAVHHITEFLFILVTVCLCVCSLKEKLHRDVS